MSFGCLGQSLLSRLGHEAVGVMKQNELPGLHWLSLSACGARDADEEVKENKCWFVSYSIFICLFLCLTQCRYFSLPQTKAATRYCYGMALDWSLLRPTPVL